jgi:hypothetical protein
MSCQNIQCLYEYNPYSIVYLSYRFVSHSPTVALNINEKVLTLMSANAKSFRKFVLTLKYSRVYRFIDDSYQKAQSLFLFLLNIERNDYESKSIYPMFENRLSLTKTL